MVFFYLNWRVNQICFNGKLISETEPVLLASNRAYRYGDGLFETIRVKDQRILLGHFHFERLFSGLSLLQYEIPVDFTISNLEEQINNLVESNHCTANARVRLSVFRGNGNLYDDPSALEYIIECWSLPEVGGELNEKGLHIDVFPFGRKSIDLFSNLKSSAFLIYAMAARFAREHKLDDCLVLNTHNKIADSTIANIFLVKNETIITPALSEGCVQGVMRRHLIESLTKAGYEIKESAIAPEHLETADEVFLTNAIKGMQWVRQFRDKVYTNVQTRHLYKHLR